MAKNPHLRIDDGYELTASMFLERRIVAALFAELARKGYTVQAVDDGDTRTPVGTSLAAMELVFNLDESLVYFAGGDRVYLVTGNGEDIISDWSYRRTEMDAPEGFNRTMEAFTSQNLAGL